MNSPRTLIASFILLLGPVALADEERAVYETEIGAGIDDVWAAFTTTEGLQSWITPKADIDFRVGGKWRANYLIDGELGDANTIENTILCYDPKRMLSLKVTKFPQGAKFDVESAKKNWSIFYFSELSPTRTKITVVGLGFTDDPKSQQLRAFFEIANKQTLAKLASVLEKKTEGDQR